MFSIEPPALARFADPYDRDRPPAPPDDFARALLWLVDDDGARRVYSSEARACALGQSWDAIMGTLRRRYLDILSKANSDAALRSCHQSYHLKFERGITPEMAARLAKFISGLPSSSGSICRTALLSMKSNRSIPRN